MMRLPVVSLLLAVLMILLMSLSSPVQELLYFNRDHLWQGWPAGLLSSHWIHADSKHLGWNLGALLLLAPLIEMRSRTLLVWSIAIGMVCVDLLLLSPWTGLQRYCGLSGVLNTLLGVALFLFWQRTRSPAVFVLALAALIKIAQEVISGQALFTNISWPPFALAHLAGIAGTPLAIWCHYRTKRLNQSLQ
jgi:hypothetical protein